VSYEQETRLILETNDDFIHFEDSELHAIIIGHNLALSMKDTPIFKHLIQLIKSKKISLVKTHVSYTSGRIIFIDYDTEIQCDGSKIEEIELENLLKHFNSY
jgi:hypothetical protein